MNRPLHHPVRNLIREKLVNDDLMYEGAIQEVIEFLEKGQISEAFFMLQDIHIAYMERKQLKGA